MFREKIKATMNARHITNKDLAEMTGINAGNLSMFLNGKRSITNKNLEIIMSALGLTLVPVEGFSYEPCRVKKTEPIE